MGYLGKIANWYFSRRALPIWGILLIDNAIVVGSYAFMFLLYNRDVRSWRLQHSMGSSSLFSII